MMAGYNPKENEVIFDVRPIGIAYKCEYCHEGEQELIKDKPIVVESGGSIPKLREHKCNKCGKTMMLPKAYPYIEWIRE